MDRSEKRRAVDIEVRLSALRGCTSQYIFISSASFYQKPGTHYLITDAHPAGFSFDWWVARHL